MADWPPMVPPTTKTPLPPPPQEREKTYLQLIDMFVDHVEPDIIQMILQNRNWDVDGALEDIMILTSSSQSDAAQHVNKTVTPEPCIEKKTTKNTVLHDENSPLNRFSPSYNESKVFQKPQANSQSKPKKQMLDKPFQYRVPDAKKVNQSQILPFIEQYNCVKATRVPFDRAVMLIKDGVKVMIILRGPPGCGKSFLARKLLLEGGIEPPAHKRHIFSSDEFFVQNNVYVFVPELLSQAHLWNQRSVTTAIREEVSPVIIDNTNTQAWEMRVYAEMAVAAGYDLEIVEPDTWWFKRDGELAKRNVHGVPRAKIRQMIERYERNITPDNLMRLYNLRYSLLKSPPQPARNCKWKDKLSNQRNNKPRKKKRDISPKPQNNLGSFNSMFQALHINSPGISQMRNDITVQNSCTTGFCFPLEVNSNEIVTKEESETPLIEISAKEETKLSPSFRNGESTQQVFFDESHSCKIFDNFMNNSSSFQKSFSKPLQSSPEPLKITDQPNDSISSGKRFHQIKDFDIMAETKKLLKALNRPSSSQSQKFDLGPEPCQSFKGSEAINALEPPESVVPGGTLVCEESEIFLHGEHLPNSEAESGQLSNLEEESRDKINVAHDLVDSIIDKAVSDLNDCSSVDPAVVSDRGLSWDYVFVNSDNTFTYQRKNSIPFGLPVVITDKTGITATDAICYDGVGYQCETKIRNIENILSSDVNESKIANNEPSDTCSKIGEVMHSNSNLKLQFLDFHEAESCPENKTSQLSIPGAVVGTNPDSTDKDELQLESEVVGHKQITETGTKSGETGNNENPNVFEIMKDFISILGPLNDNYSSFGNNVAVSGTETKTSNIHKDSLKPPSVDKFGDSHTTPIQDYLVNWNVGTDWELNKQITNEELPPKSSRSLKRPKLLTNEAAHQFNGNDYTKYLGNWDTVSNPAETWILDGADRPSNPRNIASALPQRSSFVQRSRNNKKMTDSSTNTNYLDFSLIDDEHMTGVKVLTGNINNIFSESIPEVKKNMVETLYLDKSTMTLEHLSKAVRNYDITQIRSLFPNIPEQYILDIVEKCQGDIDWAVDVLLDSEHNMVLVSTASEDISGIRDDVGEELDNLLVNVISQNVCSKMSPKREPKSPTREQTELKKLLESSVVFDRSHYSEKTLKVIKRKHPEYLHLIDDSPPQEDKNVGLETIEGSQEECKTEDEVDEVEEESSSSSCEVETEDDTMDLIMSNDLILQLQQTFGTSPLPKVADITPIVKMPLSFARQLFGYIMDSLQSDLDEQQSLIEDMIARDEEVAKLLQFQDENSRPQLQEVMDMEIALAMHKADQEELNDRGNETLAAKLSKNILVEKFPQVDPKMLAEVLQAHNYSLSDTVDSLTLGLGIGPVPSAEETLKDLPKELPKEEKERITSIIVTDDMGVAGSVSNGANPVSEAEVHRAQAASYYSLRMECLNKARDTFRSGNKTVATYYSQLAQMHKERMEQSNSKAAACLFSTHKTGKNTLDLHFLHIREAEVVLDMFLDEKVTYLSEHNKRHQTVFLITGRGLRSVGGVSRIKPMVQRKLQGRGIPYNEVNPGMLSAIVRNVTPLSYTL